MARWSKQDSRRFANWILVVVAPLNVVLILLDPTPWPWWRYMAIVLYPLIGIYAAHKLITERKVGA